MAKRECSKCGNPFEVVTEAVAIVDAAINAFKETGGGVLCPTCFKLWHNQQPEPEDTFVPQRESKYVFTDTMGEISGFGGGYEQTCRNMLAAGLDWFDEHPTADPKFQGYKDIYGVIIESNDDAKKLSKVVAVASDNDCTGAMHQAVISHILMIRKKGWDFYVQKMSEKD